MNCIERVLGFIALCGMILFAALLGIGLLAGMFSAIVGPEYCLPYIDDNVPHCKFMRHWREKHPND